MSNRAVVLSNNSSRCMCVLVNIVDSTKMPPLPVPLMTTSQYFMVSVYSNSVREMSRKTVTPLFK